MAGIADFDPKQLSPIEAKGIATDLVSLNTDSLAQVTNSLVAPSIDLVLANEASYTKFWKPIARGLKGDVESNNRQLIQLQSGVLGQGKSEVQVNQGRVLNLQTELQGTNANQIGVGTNGSPVLTGAIGGTTQGSIGPNTSPIVTLPNPTDVANGNGFIGPPISGNGTTPPPLPTPAPIIQPMPIVSGSNGTLVGPTPSTNGTKGAILPPAGNPPSFQAGGCGPPVLAGPPPDCPAGYHAQYNVSTECWECVKDPGGTPVTIPECPVGYVVTVDQATGIISCIKPPACPILPPPPKPPPPPSPIPTCPKPTNISCPEGYDFYWNPDEGGWQCTPGGVAPKPAPVPKPVVPSCQDMIDRMSLNLTVNCSDLPDDMQQRLKECGYKVCEQSIPSSPETGFELTSEFGNVLQQLLLALSIFGGLP